jgi:acetyl/propionyl-CoA carboxylase alpha subunit
LTAALEEFWIAGIRTGLPFLRRLVENRRFLNGAYDTSFVEEEMSDGPSPLDAKVRDLVLALVGVRATFDEGCDLTRFRVTLPKEEAACVEVLSSSDPIMVRVDDREIKFGLSWPESGSSGRSSPIATLRLCDADYWMMIVPRRKAGFDVGLRDRALRVKVEHEDE